MSLTKTDCEAPKPRPVRPLFVTVMSSTVLSPSSSFVPVNEMPFWTQFVAVRPVNQMLDVFGCTWMPKTAVPEPSTVKFRNVTLGDCTAMPYASNKDAQLNVVPASDSPSSVSTLFTFTVEVKAWVPSRRVTVSPASARSMAAWADMPGATSQFPVSKE